MSHLLARLPIRSASMASPIGFTRVGGGSWKEWDRFLTVDGKPAYHIGNICNTCSFLFERLEGAVRRVAVEAVVAALNDGVRQLTPQMAEQLVQLLPEGDYVACLLRCEPVRTRPGGPDDYFSHEQPALFGVDAFWDLPHDPRTEYYRLGTRTLAPGRQLFEFLVPMFPARWLDPRVVENYVAALTTGNVPTAVAISILDVKGPAKLMGDEQAHLCLTHYLLDGHHKVLAAAQSQRSVGLISLLALKQGVSEEDDQSAVLKALETLKA
jgi:hypothetical protein